MKKQVIWKYILKNKPHTDDATRCKGNSEKY